MNFSIAMLSKAPILLKLLASLAADDLAKLCAAHMDPDCAGSDTTIYKTENNDGSFKGKGGNQPDRCGIFGLSSQRLISFYH
ncbi:hypothetical protein H4Q26_012944 [Puccinia striiformis f. sp. tritici PST-130]|nr:hypothetical protein H4Q26_012944 [Puccinia striiformis f. sp. tritici PST-130]